MQETEILEVRIDDRGRVCVRPRAEFAHIYRAAAEVSWDSDRRCLTTPSDPRWTAVRWYQQILEAVRDEYGQRLVVTSATSWINVSVSDRAAIEGLVLGPRAGSSPSTA